MTEAAILLLRHHLGWVRQAHTSLCEKARCLNLDLGPVSPFLVILPLPSRTNARFSLLRFTGSFAFSVGFFAEVLTLTESPRAVSLQYIFPLPLQVRHPAKAVNTSPYIPFSSPEKSYFTDTWHLQIQESYRHCRCC